MTINSSANKTIVNGNGAQTQFAFSFVGVAAAYIAVILTDASGNETVLSRGSGATQYQIALNAPVPGALWGMGGTVTYNPSGTPIPNGSTLTIFRTLPLTQAISLQNQISLSSLGNGAETGLDTLEMQIQQVSELFGRAIVAPIVDPDTIDLTLPAAAQRANQVLGFDGSGNVIAAAAPSSGMISTAMQPVVDAATLALGRAAFGLGNIALEDIGNGLADDGAGNVHVVSVINEVTTNQAVHAANHTNIYACTGALNFTLDRADTLFEGFEIKVYALTSAITFIPNAADNFFGLASGVSLVIPKGAVATLTTDGTLSGIWFVDVAGVSPVVNVQAFTTGGAFTYTPSPGLLYAVVEAVGGGGGGGGDAGSSGFITSGGGGGGGAYARAKLTAAQIGTSQAGVVGAGGAFGSGFASGAIGVASSLGSLVVAAPGNGGGGGNSTTLASGGTGGSTGTGDLIIPGEDGATGYLANSTTTLSGSGRGGDSHLGFGGQSVVVGTPSGAVGNGGKQYGGGGSGGVVLGAPGNTNGGHGAPGIVIVTEYLAFAA